MILSVTTMPWGKKKSVSEFESVLQSIKDIGFEGVGIEHSLIPKELNHDPGMLAEIMKRVGLKNGGSYSRTKLSDIVWAKASKTPLFWVSVKEKTFPSAIKRLRDFSNRTAKVGITSAIHNELRSSFETQDQMERALEAIPTLKLCIDTAHGEGAGISTIELIEKYRKRVALIHLKDLKNKLPKSKIRFKREFVNAGEGVLDLKSVVRELEEVGYKGHLMLEIEALEGQSPDSVVKKGFDYINTIL
jgi:sugar phosphate isomerase/epimerase